ncbi:hypothetical protein EJ08DRAFT_706194 [Tothia fuscella]|uniref:Uncharacterized protein n=1 Tax=Tothia fuscella TaxID=1048955 RepID=A0A9P4U1F0_9PEZI|nr:hypothetical protein EJ08DRAFT_706194 [Tothia fuscella]
MSLDKNLSQLLSSTDESTSFLEISIKNPKSPSTNVFRCCGLRESTAARFINNFSFTDANAWTVFSTFANTIREYNLKLVDRVIIQVPFCKPGCAHTYGSCDRLEKRLSSGIGLHTPMDSRYLTPDMAFKIGIRAIQIAKPKSLKLVMPSPDCIDLKNEGDGHGLSMWADFSQKEFLEADEFVFGGAQRRLYYNREKKRNVPIHPHRLRSKEYMECFRKVDKMLPGMKISVIRLEARESAESHREEHDAVVAFVEQAHQTGWDVEATN